MNQVHRAIIHIEVTDPRMDPTRQAMMRIVISGRKVQQYLARLAAGLLIVMIVLHLGDNINWNPVSYKHPLGFWWWNPLSYRCTWLCCYACQLYAFWVLLHKTANLCWLEPTEPWQDITICIARSHSSYPQAPPLLSCTS